jgi:hypothetical protein
MKTLEEKIKFVELMISILLAKTRNYALCHIYYTVSVNLGIPQIGIIAVEVHMKKHFRELYDALNEVNNYDHFGNKPIGPIDDNMSRLVFLSQFKEYLMRQNTATSRLWVIDGGNIDDKELIKDLFREHAHSKDTNSRNTPARSEWTLEGDDYFGLSEENYVHWFNSKNMEMLNPEVITIEEAFKRLGKEMPRTKNWGVKGGKDIASLLKLLFEGYDQVLYPSDLTGNPGIWNFQASDMIYQLLDSKLVYGDHDYKEHNLEIISLEEAFKRLGKKMPRLWAVEGGDDTAKILSKLFDGYAVATSTNRNKMCTKGKDQWTLSSNLFVYGLSESGLVYGFLKNEIKELKIEIVSIEEAFKRLGKKMPKPKLWAICGGDAEKLRHLFKSYSHAKSEYPNKANNHWSFTGTDVYYGLSEKSLVYCFTKRELEEFNVEVISIEEGFKRLNVEMILPVPVPKWIVYHNPLTVTVELADRLYKCDYDISLSGCDFIVISNHNAKGVLRFKEIPMSQLREGDFFTLGEAQKDSLYICCENFNPDKEYLQVMIIRKSGELSTRVAMSDHTTTVLKLV